MKKIRVLIVGSGGREHALAWKAAQSPIVEKVFVAPGNAGTALEPRVANIDIKETDLTALLKFAEDNKIKLTIVGPEVPLAAGIVDLFQQHKLTIFGPTRIAAQLESSKAFSKAFMQRHNIPTADYRCFDAPQEAKDYLQNHEFPVVIKADGLAAGKGVVIARTRDAAEQAVDKIFSEHCAGESGHCLIVEDYLVGEEASFICLSDGEHILPLESSKDHKARDDGNRGPNTGGMGAYSPAPTINHLSVYKKIINEVMSPAIAGMREEGIPFVGFLYAGLMFSPDGKIYVLEFNCRLGDPETQPILMRLRSDFIELCLLAVNGKLHKASVEWDLKTALGVVLASAGYPGNYERGMHIKGLDDIHHEDTKVFHAGTCFATSPREDSWFSPKSLKRKKNRILTSGGRVLCVTSLGNDIKEAKQRAYEACSSISWEGVFGRKDIG